MTTAVTTVSCIYHILTMVMNSVQALLCMPCTPFKGWQCQAGLAVVVFACVALTVPGRHAEAAAWVGRTC